jgi:hypothetical protein
MIGYCQEVVVMIDCIRWSSGALFDKTDYGSAPVMLAFARENC